MKDDNHNKECNTGLKRQFQETSQKVEFKN